MICPECNTSMVNIEKFWFCGKCGRSVQFTDNNNDENIDNYFYTDAFEEYYSIIAHEYYRLYILMKEKKYYGTLLQLKDVLEVMLKFPVLITVNYIWQKEEPDNIDKEIIKSMLEKPLSLGDWEAIGNKIKNNYKGKIEELKHVNNIIVSVCDIYSNYKVVKWRNDKIGHGALSFTAEEDFLKEMKELLLAIKNHMEKYKEDYMNLNLYNENDVKLKGKDNARNLLHEKEDLYISIGEKKLYLYPFIIMKNKAPNMFDSYNHRYCDAFILDYLNGYKGKEHNIAKILNSKSKLFNIEKLKESTINDKAFDSEELKKLFSTGDDSESFVKPEYIVQSIKNYIENEPKGVFMLQMERGMGKTTFCKALDQLSLMNKIVLDEDMAVRAYYINDTINYKLNYFQDKCITILKDKKTGTMDINFNAYFLDSDNKKKAFATVLNNFHMHYKPQNQLGKNKFCFIIDGLDEIKRDGEGSIFDYIPSGEDLDEGVYVLLASRTMDEMENENKLFIGENIDKIEKDLTKPVICFCRDNENNKSLLKNYIRKNIKKPVDEGLIDAVIEKGEHRFLYVKALKELMVSIDDFDIDTINNNSLIINQYLKILKDKCGNEKYYSSIVKLLVIIAILEEPATIEEISYLYGQETTNLKFVAQILDLRGLLKVERSHRGDLYSMHDEWKKYLIEENKDLIEEIVKEWFEDIKDEIQNKTASIEKSDGKSYLYSYIFEYISKYYENAVNESYDESFVKALNRFAYRLDYVGSYIYEKLRGIRIYTHVIDIRTTLLKEGNLGNLNDLAKVHMNRGNTYQVITRYEEALKDYEKAIEIISKLAAEGKLGALNYLATVHMNRGIVYANLTRYEEALKDYEKVFEILKKLFKEKMLGDPNCLVVALMNRGSVLYSLTKYDEALKDYEKALKIRKILEETGQSVDLNNFADVYMNRGALYGRLMKYEEALKDYKKAIEIRRSLVKGGELVNLNDLAAVYMNRGTEFYNLTQYEKSLNDYKKAIDIRTKLMQIGKLEDMNDLAIVYMNRGVLYHSLMKHEEALEDYKKAIEIENELLQNGKLGDINDLASLYMNRAAVYESLAFYEEAIKDAKESLNYKKNFFKERPWLQGEYCEILSESLKIAIQHLQSEGVVELVKLYYEPIADFVTDEEAKKHIDIMKKMLNDREFIERGKTELRG